MCKVADMYVFTIIARRRRKEEEEAVYLLQQILISVLCGNHNVQICNLCAILWVFSFHDAEQSL
jgi:hypothetical protein